jgi:hypothetical protein
LLALRAPGIASLAKLQNSVGHGLRRILPIQWLRRMRCAQRIHALIPYGVFDAFDHDKFAAG